MDDPKPIEFDMEISTSDDSAESTDRTKRELLAQLRDMYVESVAWIESRFSTKGDKSELIGTITLTVLPTVLPSVIAFVQSWVARQPDRTVKLKGKGIEFEGSPEELQKILARLAGDSTTAAPPPDVKKKKRGGRK